VGLKLLLVLECNLFARDVEAKPTTTVTTILQ
jgi:hypothetical protein